MEKSQVKNSEPSVYSYCFTWLVAAILVYLIMTETDKECGHTKATLYARDVNKSCKMVTFSHLNFSNFSDNFK